MRILHLIHGLTTGGAEVDLVRKSAALVRDYGCAITIACLMRRGELAPVAEDAGAAVIGPLMRGRYDLVASISLRRLLLDQRWDVVHAHLFAANLVGSLVRSTLPIRHRPRFLASEHAMADRWSAPALWSIRHVIQKQAERVFVPSQAAAASYRKAGISREKLAVIANALDPGPFDGLSRSLARKAIVDELHLSPDSPLIGTVARLQPVKGLPVLVQSMSEVPGHLIMVGEGPEREAIAEVASRAGLSERIHFLGIRQDIPFLLAAFDVFVFLSYSESFGIVVAEALLAGTPVVATGVGGIPEITGSGAFAELVPPGDSSALAAALSETLRQPVQAQQRASAGGDYVREHFSLANVAAMQYNHYRQISKELDQG
jgi:glycosyltransferase involved in cell wall biosynthesis